MAIPAVPASEAAIAELYREHGRALFRLAYRLTASKEDAEDVVHDVFVGLPEAMKTYKERGRFESWLKRITARVALMKLRARRRRGEVHLDSEIAVKGTLPGAEVIALHAAVAALPDTLRHVLVLKEVEGYSHREIGDMLGISVLASRVRLARALRRLRGILGESR